jgi:hypothetical protein
MSVTYEAMPLESAKLMPNKRGAENQTKKLLLELKVTLQKAPLQ